MALKKRNDEDVSAAAEEFVSGAEKDHAWQDSPEASLKTTAQRYKERGEGRKFGMYTVRGTERQLEFMQYAAKKLGMSQNELYLRYTLGKLEEEIGEDLPTD